MRYERPTLASLRNSRSLQAVPLGTFAISCW